MALCTFRKSIFKTNITNWQQIPFTNRDINPFPQDISISPCGEYVVTMTHRPVLLLVYDLVENKLHSSIGSTDYKPTDFYWISPEMICVRVVLANHDRSLKKPEYATAIYSISTSEILILLVNGTFSGRHWDVFISNNSIFAIDPNKSIAIYDLKTCTKTDRKIDFGDQIKTVLFIEPSEVTPLPFIGNNWKLGEDPRDEVIYGGKCMKFMDELILISKMKSIKIKSNMEDDDDDEFEPHNNYKYKENIQMYLFDTHTRTLSSSLSLFEDIESKTIVYDQGNAKWNWSNSTKFLLYLQKGATIEIIEGKINSGFDITYNTLKTVKACLLPWRYDVGNHPFFVMRYIGKQNVLIKGKRTVQRVPYKYSYNEWGEENYYNHNLISLNHDALAKGDIVRIVGLKSKPHWNDKLATITGEYDVNRGRWPIQINFGDRMTALVKTENVDKSVTYLPSETDYAAYIDQLSGLWFVQSRIKESEEEYTAGFNVMDHAKQIGFIKYPNFNGEATVIREVWGINEILLDIGASGIICVLKGHQPVRQLYYADLGSQPQYFAILEKLHQNPNINCGDFGQLTRALVRRITEFLGN
eukprot:996808_1